MPEGITVVTVQMDHRIAVFLHSFDVPVFWIRKAWRIQFLVWRVSSGISCSLPCFGRHFPEESSFGSLCGSAQWSRAVTTRCWCPYSQFKVMHSTSYLAAVTGPGLVLWKSMLEPESLPPWNAALTIWFRQFWCMSSIIRSASSTIWIHKDQNHHLSSTESFYFPLYL